MTDTTERIFCNSCLKVTRHLIVASHDVKDSDEEISWEDKYQIVVCKGCDNVTFRIDHTDSDSYHYDDGLLHTYLHYPPAISRKHPSWFEELPREIKSVLQEIYIALHAGCHYLATVGARTVLDLTIVDKIGDAGTFQAKIAKLESEGHITSPEAKLMEAVIEAGNASAHRGYCPTSGDFNDMMDILESLLDKIYLADARQEKLEAKAEWIKRNIPPRK